jgi:molybdopterin/thiamine biosynthesis adenylyltransferase
MSSRKLPSYLSLYAAQVPVLGRTGQTRLRRARVHVFGCGGVGSQVVLNLAAAGVGHITVNDPQSIGIDNLNRFAMATLDDLDVPKVELLRRILEGRPYLKFYGLAAHSEDQSVNAYAEAADLLICCSNTAASRVRASRLAVTYGKSIIDVSVADGRRALAGFIKFWHPDESAWSACPACYLENTSSVERREGLLPSVIATIATLATHIALLNLAPLRNIASQNWNMLVIELNALRMETLAVQKRAKCAACNNQQQE